MRGEREEGVIERARERERQADRQTETERQRNTGYKKLERGGEEDKRIMKQADR